MSGIDSNSLFQVIFMGMFIISVWNQGMTASGEWVGPFFLYEEAYSILAEHVQC